MKSYPNPLMIFVTASLLTTISTSLTWAADELVPVGSSSQRPQQQSPNIQPAPMNAVPVGFSTNYTAQYPPYASFMQSPYPGGMGMPYGAAPGPSYAPGGGYPGGTYPYSSSPYPPVSPVAANSVDPYSASEVSPYAHYSPYMEVIGEGSNYTLGVDDVVTIIVRNQPDFSGRFVVDPEGNIQYNFVGDIPAVGKTKEELKQEIVKRLTRFIRYPEVAVMISEYRSKAVYVYGFVNAPGKYAMKGDKITVKEAIFAAGLPRLDGSLKRVYVIRPDDSTETGKPEKKKVNLDKLLQKGISVDNFMLQPGDTLIVHQRYFDRFVNAFSRLVGPLFQAAAVYELGFGNDSNGFLRKNN